MKKILINTIPLLSPLTGIGRYCYEVSKCIEQTKNYNTTFHYGYNSKYIIYPSNQINIKKTKSVLVSNSLIKTIIKKFIKIFYKLFGSTYDLYWEPNFIPQSYIKSKKTVTSVHDFSFILHKQFHKKRYNKIL